MSEPGRIYLGYGFFAEVDLDDYPDLMTRVWHLSISKCGLNYARASFQSPTGAYAESIHRFLLGLVQNDGKKGDHRDGNGLNNRRSNLRIATNEENSRNSRKRWDNRSGARGVYFSKDGNVWVAQMHMGGKNRSLGRFLTLEAASACYEKAAKERYGEFYRPPEDALTGAGGGGTVTSTAQQEGTP